MVMTIAMTMVEPLEIKYKGLFLGNFVLLNDPFFVRIGLATC